MKNFKLAIILFHNKSNIFWTRFLRDYKHVSCVCFDDYNWINFDCAWPLSRINYAILKPIPIEELLNGFRQNPTISSYVCMDIDDAVYIRRWYGLMINSCVEFVKRITGINVGFTLTPKGLLKKIICNHAKNNYRIINLWERNYGSF